MNLKESDEACARRREKAGVCEVQESFRKPDQETGERRKTKAMGSERRNSENVYYDRHGKLHHRRCFRSEYRHHHHHHHHRKAWQRVLLIVCAVLLLCGCSAFAAWRVLDAVGRKNLYKSAEGQAPTLAKENTEQQTAVQESQKVWKDGWVRYQDRVYEYNEGILTFLIMGIDDLNYVQEKSGGQGGGQADSLFLLVMNPDTKKISVVAINRNTMTEIDVYDTNGNFDHTGTGQICLAHGYGDGMEESCEREEKAVSNLFYSLPISGYVAINMGAVPMINDAVGGVTVPRMTYKDGTIEYGEDQTLMGEEAYRFVQNRSLTEFDSAGFRLEKQKIYLKALMTKMLASVKENPATIVNLYQAISPYMVTDVSVSEVTYLAGQMREYSLDLDTIYSLEGETKMGDQGFEEFYYDENALYEMMLQVFYREVPEDEYQGKTAR